MIADEKENKPVKLAQGAPPPLPPASNVLLVNIDDEMKSCYLDYAMSVIVGRALPDVRDGLKPVHRRSLYAMYDLSNFHNKPFKKSARVVGDIIGKYHPHGDAPVYGTIVRMAQDFSLRYPLIEGQGNFGSIDGDNAAHMRYTEVRMAKVAEELLADLEKETVDFGPNYDGSLKEPLVFPSKIPNLLINGSSGIAVGMATNIPPHNLSEVVQGCIALIDHPETSVEELIKIIPGPDFPTYGFIYGKKGLKEAYTEGRGIIQMRAKAEIEEQKRGDRESIIVTELPYLVNKAKLIESVADFVRNRKIEDISDIRDESDRKGMRIVFDLKRGAVAGVVLNKLFQMTQMQSSFGIIMLALDNYVPKVLNIKEMLQLFVSHRKEVVTRRTAFDLKKAQEKLHVLEGLKIAVENIDEVIALIKKSKEPQVAKEALIKKFELSEIQAQAILDLKLQRLTGLERDKIIQEHKDTVKFIKELKDILADEKLIFKIIKTELEEIIKNYGDKRRTKIIARAEEVTVEDLIAKEDVIVTVTHSGYVKRLPQEAYRTQKRGGKGVKGMGTREEDFVEQLFIGSTHDYMLFFSNLGRLYWLKTYQLPEAGRAAKGKALINLLQLSEGERITTALPVRDFKEGFLVMFTKNGTVKKTALEEYSNPRGKGIIAVTIEEGDELIAVKKTDGKSDLIIGTKSGLSIRFNEEDVREMGRTAKGVIGMRLAKGDEVVSAEVAEERTALLTVTEKGLGKRTKIEDYRVQGRGGKGVISIKVIEKGGKGVGLMQVSDEDEIVMITNSGKIIRTTANNISLLGRNTQGVKLMDVDAEDKIVSISKVVEKD